MMKDVVISIRSLHNYGMEDEDTIDFITDGLYSVDGDTASLSYMESAVTGLPGTRTSVTVTPDRIVVDRDGCLTSQMVFREGEKNSFVYNTPNGSATLLMNTRRISHRLDEHGGQIELDYILGLDHVNISSNKFSLNITEQKSIGGRSHV